MKVEMKNLLKYSEAFAHLRRERSPSVWAAKTAFGAPHKPLLLLSVMDLFARGETTSSLIEINSALEEQFASYWVSVTGRAYVDDIVHPFFALRNEPQEFWALIPREGKNDLLNTRPDWVRLNLDHLKQCVRGARLGKELVQLFQIAESRLTLREVLVNTYFSAATKLELAELIPSIPSEYAATTRKQSTLNRILRDSSIKRLYDYACQICQTRLTVGEEAYAEAAHIKPLGLPHNGPDYSTNLLCLCPNHHVLFDLGGISLTNNLKLLPGGASLVVRSSHTIDREFLRYHREVIYARCKG